MFGICLVTSGRENATAGIYGPCGGYKGNDPLAEPPTAKLDGRPAPVEVQWKSHPDATRISLARHLHTTGMFFKSALFSPKNAVLGAENAAPESGIMLDTQEVMYSGSRRTPSSSRGEIMSRLDGRTQLDRTTGGKQCPPRWTSRY